MQEGVNVSLEERETLVSLGTADARSRAWRTYFEASGRLQGVLESRMKAHFNIGLSDYSILLSLWEAKNHTMRMGDIAKAVVYSPSRVTYLVNNLVQDGLVERIPSAMDGRGFDAVLTEKGTEVVSEVTLLHQRLLRDYLLAGLTEDQVDSLVEIMAALEKHMRYRTFFY